jgi:hypothetical protein
LVCHPLFSRLDSIPQGFLRGGLRDSSWFSGPIDKLVLGVFLARVCVKAEAVIWARMVTGYQAGGGRISRFWTFWTRPFTTKVESDLSSSLLYI